MQVARTSQWPKFSVPVPDPILGEVYAGKNGFTPEQSLIEFISTSAAFHGVKKQALRNLEWDLLKVFVNNVMPANAAAWYMAKRKFYMDQAFDQQLLPHVLKKHPDKFKVVSDQVVFLEMYSKEVAKQKLQFLVHHGLFAYFDHKADDYGVYFFDPYYYQNTEPFHEALKLCTQNKVIQGKLIAKYFSSESMQKAFNLKTHTGNLVSICKQPGVKVITNTTGVIVSMINSHYGFVKFGQGEKALFCAKSLFRDGWQYNGDPLKLPAIKIDGYQIPDPKAEKNYSWYAVLVWCGRRPNPKYCSTAEDLKSTPVFREGRLSTVSSLAGGEGRKLRQPSSSMMIGKVIEVRRNGAVLRVREDGPDKVFVPGWMRQLANKPGTWLSTASGECIGLGDLVAYYVDSETKAGYTAVGKNVMVLKESKEVEEEQQKKARKKRRKSRTTSEATVASTMEDAFSDSDESVTGEELAWLEMDLNNMISREDPGAKTLNLLRGVHSKLHSVSVKIKKPVGKIKPDKPGYTPMNNVDESFWRMKHMFATLDPGYHSDSDEDYKPGDDVERVIRAVESSSKSESENTLDVSRGSGHSRVRTTTASSILSRGGRKESMGGSMRGRLQPQQRDLPYWVRAVSKPEEFDAELGKFVPVDNVYDEERDPDYELPETDLEEEEEEEDIDVEELLKESKEELPEDIASGNYRTGPTPISPVKITVTSPDDQKEGGEEDITTVAGEPEPAMPEPLAVQPQVPLWVRELAEVEQDEEYDSDEDPEFIPPAVIADTDVDYDEFSDDGSSLKEELSELLREANSALSPPACYFPIWVRVESPEERLEKAKEEHRGKESGKEVEQVLQKSPAPKMEAGLESGLTPAMKGLMIAKWGMGSTVATEGAGGKESGVEEPKLASFTVVGAEDEAPKPAREKQRKKSLSTHSSGPEGDKDLLEEKV